MNGMGRLVTSQAVKARLNPLSRGLRSTRKAYPSEVFQVAQDCWSVSLACHDPEQSSGCSIKDERTETRIIVHGLVSVKACEGVRTV